jgi:cytochrome c oxidase subunit 3
MYLWWRDVVREATYLGSHTLVVARGLILGFKLFIATEVMFFFGFFWAYFDAAFAPTM